MTATLYVQSVDTNRSSSRVFFCDAVQSKAEATDCPQLQLLLQLMLPWGVIWACGGNGDNFATSPVAVVVSWVTEQMTTPRDRNEKL